MHKCRHCSLHSPADHYHSNRNFSPHVRTDIWVYRMKGDSPGLCCHLQPTSDLNKPTFSPGDLPATDPSPTFLPLMPRFLDRVVADQLQDHLTIPTCSPRSMTFSPKPHWAGGLCPRGQRSVPWGPSLLRPQNLASLKPHYWGQSPGEVLHYLTVLSIDSLIILSMSCYHSCLLSFTVSSTLRFLPKCEVLYEINYQ